MGGGEPKAVGIGDIEILVYDYCEARISRLSQLLFPLYFY